MLFQILRYRKGRRADTELALRVSGSFYCLFMKEVSYHNCLLQEMLPFVGSYPLPPPLDVLVDADGLQSSFI